VSVLVASGPRVDDAKGLSVRLAAVAATGGG
jgi:hypothetical protein